MNQDLDVSMVLRYGECVMSHGYDNAPQIQHIGKYPGNETVLNGQAVHVMFRKGNRLFCTWVPKGFVSDLGWFFTAYG